jgi:hypothetical protein
MRSMLGRCVLIIISFIGLEIKVRQAVSAVNKGKISTSSIIKNCVFSAGILPPRIASTIRVRARPCAFHCVFRCVTCASILRAYCSACNNCLTFFVIHLTSTVCHCSSGLEFYRGNCRRGRTKCRGSLRQRRQFFAV